MKVAIHLISDFNIEPLARLLANSERAPAIDAVVAPFGQVVQALTGASADPSRTSLVWTRAEAVIESFARAVRMEEVDHRAVLEEVDAFADLLVRHASIVRTLFVPTWTLPPAFRGYGPLEWRPNTGITYLVARMNARLAEALASAPNAFVLDAERWMRPSGMRATSPKLWFATKVPFAAPVFTEAAEDIRAALIGLAGQSRRLVILDLDDTLWGGIVGDVGPGGVTLGGHDHEGEAFTAFQSELKALTRRGIQLAIASKNDESVAFEVIDNHSDMRLRRSDFAAWRIDWNDKAQNVARIVEEVNLGLASVVFIDDNPVERARVREALPEVLVPEWPDDPTRYVDALRALRCFDTASVSREDRERTSMYAAERERRATRVAVGSIDAWLEQLGVEVHVAPLSAVNLTRAGQLFNKTNQLNLSTRRLDPQQLLHWAQAPGHWLWTVSVSDRFGQSGLTGIVSLDVQGDDATIVDFILSCRVMGRSIEHALVHVAVEQARAQGARKVTARYLPTARNRPTLDFWQQTPFRVKEEHVFVWDTAEPYALPKAIKLVRDETSSTATEP